MNPRLTRQLDAVVLRGLAEEPKNRFASVREFVDGFDQALADSSTKARLVAHGSCGLDRESCSSLAGLAWIVRPGVEARRPDRREDMQPAESVATPAVANPVKPPDAGQTG